MISLMLNNIAKSNRKFYWCKAYIKVVIIVEESKVWQSKQCKIWSLFIDNYTSSLVLLVIFALKGPFCLRCSCLTGLNTSTNFIMLICHHTKK